MNAQSTQAARRPIVPEDLHRSQGRSPGDAFRPVIRHTAAKALAWNANCSVDAALRRLYGDGEAERIERAATTPMTLTNTPALAGSGIGPLLGFLRGSSAAAELFSRVPRVSLNQYGTMLLPGWASQFPAPPWVEESQPIPVLQGSVEPVTLGPVRKLAGISVITGELNDLTGEQAEVVVGAALRDAAGRALDSAVFGNLAATAARVAGLLNGVTPLTATTGGGLTAAAGDVGNLTGAIATAGGGSDIIFIASPRQAAVVRMLSPGFPVIAAPSLAAGTVIAIEREGVVTAFSGEPDIDIARDATLHMEDTNPAHIGTVNPSPPPATIVAAPVRSLFQTFSYGIRVILDAAWAKRFPGAVQVVNSASW